MVATQESDLIARLREPETRTAAFEQVVGQYQELLYYHARRMVGSHDDADDVLQNAFIKAWKNLDKFRGEASIKTWLYRITTNESLSHLQRMKRRRYTGLEDLQNDMRHSGSGSADPDPEFIQELLGQAIETLPDRQRAVFHLRYYEELPYDEIAEITGVTTGSLKASYHHAVKKVENYLKQHATV